MSDRALAPILVGITGKRDLRGKDDAVRAALIACFDLLDEKFPASPKILLSGLAAGTDIIAAKAVVERPNWRLVAAMPLPPDLYEQDFDQAQLADLRLLLNKDGVRPLVLDLLRDPATNQAYGRKALARSPNGPSTARSDHYEQLGLYIAERATILIGVMPASEAPGKVGGTARVLDFRVRGDADDTASRAIEGSEVLRQRQPLDWPEPGLAWLIDLDRVATPQVTSALGSVQLWRPRLLEASGQIEVEKISSYGCKEDLVRELRLAARIEAFNRRVIEIDDQRWEREVEERAGKDADTASSLLRRFRAALAAIQGNDKLNLKVTAATLSLLFVIAVTVLVIGSEFRMFLVLYLFILLVSLLVFGFARVRRWQQYTEDYRGLAEALRVQLAWWDQGFVTAKDRVDRIYLFGAFGSLGLVRAAIRHLIDVALLDNDPPTPSPDAEIGWIKGQISYFTQRVKERQLWMTLSDDLVWFLFVASFGMALAIVAEISQKFLQVHPHIPRWLAALLATVVPLGMFWLSHSFSRLARKQPHKSQRWLLKTLALVTAGVTGGLLALLVFYFAPSAVDAGRLLASRGLPAACAADSPSAVECANIIGTKLVLILATVITAIAGALRFYVETLAFEPELHQYREALVIFQRAQTELSKIEGDQSLHARKRRADILMSLGEKALAENEAWIRAHRLRPLEPRL